MKAMWSTVWQCSRQHCQTYAFLYQFRRELVVQLQKTSGSHSVSLQQSEVSYQFFQKQYAFLSKKRRWQSTIYLCTNMWIKRLLFITLLYLIIKVYLVLQIWRWKTTLKNAYILKNLQHLKKKQRKSNWQNFS